MTTPTPSVPVPDFASVMLVEVPQQLLKQFTSSPQMVGIGILIIAMFVVGIYGNARKKRKQQEAAAAKKANSGRSRRASSSRSRLRTDGENAEPVTIAPERAVSPVVTDTIGLIHKIIWSPVGNLTLVSDEGVLSGVYHEGQSIYPNENELGAVGSNASLDEAERQLNEYFAGERVRFNLTLKEDPQTFDRNVWTGVSKIPYGETWTVGHLTESLGYKEGSATYVSGAVNRNRFAIVIPSHRIVPATGKGKYVGGTANKDFLLTLEGKHRSS